MASRQRKTRGKTRHGRSHHKLANPRLSKDGGDKGEGGIFHLRHRVNLETGEYRGRQVIDVDSKKSKKLARMKDKARRRGLDPAEVDESEVLEPDQSLRS